MKTLLKFVGGLALGATLGAGVYLLVTKESNEGIIRDIKEGINRAIAEERRKQLEQELGFPIDDEPPAIPVPPPQQ